VVSTNQNDCLTTQITGICVSTNLAATIARSDIANLRACLIPELRGALASLFIDMKSLQGRLLTLGTTLDDHQNFASTTSEVNALPGLAPTVGPATKILPAVDSVAVTKVNESPSQTTHPTH
jgi:hypothetical protein